MKKCNLLCLTGLLFILWGCEEKTDHIPDPGTPSHLPDQLKGYFSIHSITTGLTDSVLITSVEFTDTVGSTVFLRINYDLWPYKNVVVMAINGTGYYPFHSGTGTVLPGESIVSRFPRCGEYDSDPGGWHYGSIGGLDSNSYVHISQFNSLGIEGTYQGKFRRVGISSTCQGYPLDTVDVWGSFKTSF